MTQPPVPLIVLTGREDDVELINRVLREAGHAARCKWVSKLDALAEALAAYQPELLWCFTDSLAAPLKDVAKIKQQTARMVPLIAVSRTVEEADIAAAMAAGAQDLVSVGLVARLRSVAERELRSFRLERALNQTVRSASQYKTQLRAFLAGSVDAIAHVQEGILVDANQAWAGLFGREDPQELHGPLMDSFEAASQAALKGALAACAKGQWDNQTLKVTAVGTDNAPLPLELSLEPTVFDGENAVKLTVPHRPNERAGDPQELLEEAVHKDPLTGFYHRRRFIELLAERLGTPPRSGVRALAYIRPDKFGEIAVEVGPVQSEEILVQLARLLGSVAHSNDIAGRFGGTVFAMLLERGTLRDIEAWAEHAASRISDQIFEVAQNTLSLTCTIGLAEVGPSTGELDELLAGAERANQRGRQRGGNQVVLEETAEESTRVQRFDEFWVQQIKSALMENRFRLAHMPIASLGGEAKNMLDTLVRLIDQQGDEVPASEFMPAAARNRMLRAIDRWVIGATVHHCAKQTADVVFVKLSSESLLDATLVEWVRKQAKEFGVEPARVCFQVSEEDATQYLKQTKGLAEQLKTHGFLFAVEHFGIGRDPLKVLAQTPMQFLKIDGSLMQSLATNQALQDKVRGFVTAAERRKVQTIAERVEDANTMAVLFQLGIGYMQGHYVHEPEVVLGEHR